MLSSIPDKYCVHRSPIIQAITDAAFSPDGTALATASLDGDVRFFQVNLQENSSRYSVMHWTAL